MPETTHSPSLGVYTDRQILDEMFLRLKRNAIQVHLIEGAEAYAHLRVSGMGRDGRYGFEWNAYPTPVAPI